MRLWALPYQYAYGTRHRSRNVGIGWIGFHRKFQAEQNSHWHWSLFILVVRAAGGAGVLCDRFLLHDTSRARSWLWGAAVAKEVQCTYQLYVCYGTVLCAYYHTCTPVPYYTVDSVLLKYSMCCIEKWLSIPVEKWLYIPYLYNLCIRHHYLSGAKAKPQRSNDFRIRHCVLLSVTLE